MIHITFQSLYRGYGCVEVSFESCLSSKPSFLYCCCISRRLVSKTSVRTNTMLVIVFSLSVPCMIVYFLTIILFDTSYFKAVQLILLHGSINYRLSC